MGNELPFGISPQARQAIIAELDSAHLYPDSSYYDLKQALSNYTSFSENYIVVGNGSTQFIDGFYHGFLKPGESVLFVPPDYGPYRIRLQMHGGVAQLAPRTPPDYNWTLDPIIDAINPETRILVLISPNNPVGNCIREDDLRQLLERDLLVVLDEAYYEFADITHAPLVKEYNNLVVTRTFAKAFGFAGLRLGYAITTPDLAAYLTKVLHHFPVNRLTAAAAIAALQDTAFLNYVKNEIQSGRRYLEDALNQIPGVRAFPSKTNFVLCQLEHSNVSSYDVAQNLIQKGIIIRDYSGKPGLEGQFVRITVGTQDQNEAVIASIKAVLKTS
jgi:histidinol-phosphate aminotransferase